MWKCDGQKASPEMKFANRTEIGRCWCSTWNVTKKIS